MTFEDIDIKTMSDIIDLLDAEVIDDLVRFSQLFELTNKNAIDKNYNFPFKADVKLNQKHIDLLKPVVEQQRPLLAVLSKSAQAKM